MTYLPAFAHPAARLVVALVLVLTTLPLSVLSPSGAPGAPSMALAAGTLNVNDVTMDEGDSGTVTFEFTVSLTEAAPADGVRFNIATANGTAVAGPDYVANILTGQVIPAGGTDYTFRVEVRGDSTNEPDETFLVNITNVVGASPGDVQGVGTIRNDDNRFLSIDDVIQAEGNGGMTPFTFRVSLSQPAPASGVSFNIGTQPGTASANTDFIPKSLLNQVIAAGESSYSFTVDVRADTTTEPDEMFLVNVSNVIGATARDFQGMATITNDDNRILRIADASRSEGDTGHGALTFAVTLSEAAPPEGVRFDIATSDGTAKAGSDFFHRALIRQYIGPGATYYGFSVSIMGDRHDEPDETFTVTLTNVVSAVIGDATATGTIVDDDGDSGGGGGGGTTTVLSISGVTKAEGSSGNTVFSFPVSLSAPAPAGGVSFSIATAAGSAAAGSDFIARSLANQSIAAGATSYTFNVDVVGDTAVESDESFQVVVSSIVGATAGTTTATGVIQNDDQPAGTLTLSVADAQVDEGHSSTTTLTFTINLSGPAPAGGVQFNAATADGTATAGSDYVAKTQTGLSIAAGGTSTSFSVQVTGDTAVEPDETFTVQPSNVAGAVAAGSGTGTIRNDDTLTISIGDASVTEGNGGTVNLTFPVSLSQPASAGGVTFSVATSNGSATAGSDYTSRALTNHTLAAGATAFSFTVEVTGDTLLEPDETVVATLSEVSGATIARGQATGTILNDDSATVGGKNLAISTEPVRLTWDAGVGQQSYYVIKADVARGTSTEHGPLDASATAWVDAQASPEVLACYTVLAVGEGGVLGSSDMLCAQIGVQNGAPVPGEFTLSLNQSTTATLTWTAGDGAFSEVVLGVLPLGLTGQTATHRLAGTARRHTLALPGADATCYLVAGVKDGAAGTTNVLCANPGVHGLAANGPTGWSELAQGRLVRPGRTAAPANVRATGAKVTQRVTPYRTRPAALIERAKQLVARAVPAQAKATTGASKPKVPTTRSTGGAPAASAGRPEAASVAPEPGRGQRAN